MSESNEQSDQQSERQTDQSIEQSSSNESNTTSSELKITSSLTAPWDRDTLTSEEVAFARQKLYDMSYLEKFPMREKTFCDPIYNSQNFCIHSFVPSKGATPDSRGVFGFMKCRGTFTDKHEAKCRAEFLLKYHDSYHAMQTGYCGKPFPVCVDSRKYCETVDEVDIKEHAKSTINEDLLEKRREEKKQIDEIKEREKKLLEESKEDYKEDPMERYTTLHVKRASIMDTYERTKKHLEELKRIIVNTRKEIKIMDKENRMYKKEYKDKYLRTREELGLPIDDEAMASSALRYIIDDVNFEF